MFQMSLDPHTARQMSELASYMTERDSRMGLNVEVAPKGTLQTA